MKDSHYGSFLICTVLVRKTFQRSKYQLFRIIVKAAETSLERTVSDFKRKIRKEEGEETYTLHFTPTLVVSHFFKSISHLVYTYTATRGVGGV